MNTKVKGEAIKEGSIPLSTLDDKLKNEINCKYGLGGIVTILNSNNTTSDIFTISDYFVYVSSKNTVIKLTTGGQTDLAQLGGPSTIITSEVINGYKVKFSVSGSMSYYGDLIIGNLYNKPPQETPDWNAQEGEPGYIDNKPFGISYIGDTYFGDNMWELNRDDYYIFVAHNSYNDIYIDDVGYFRFSEGMSQNFTIDGAGVITVENLGRFPTITYQDYFDTEEEAAEFLNNVLKMVIFDTLNDVFLPNTVVKTTPQSLSNTDKNQALANLGIADLLEALKPVRLSGFPPIGIVTQEQLDEVGLTEKVINNILNGYTDKIYIGTTLYRTLYANNNEIDQEFIFAYFDVDRTGAFTTIGKFRYYKNSDEILIEMDEM